jgi:small subunit ribosomal protein S21
LLPRAVPLRFPAKSIESNGFFAPGWIPLDGCSKISGIIEKPYWQVWRWDFLAEVRVQEGEPLENALRRFKRKVQQEDIIKEVKRHSYYLKPGEKRRVKAALARKRNRKKARKEQD